MKSFLCFRAYTHLKAIPNAPYVFLEKLKKWFQPFHALPIPDAAALHQSIQDMAEAAEAYLPAEPVGSDKISGIHKTLLNAIILHALYCRPPYPFKILEGYQQRDVP